MNNIALIIVDVQRDFLPGGPFAVPEGDEVLDAIAEIVTERAPDLVIATRDWHPVDHCSFVANGGIWPTHCVAGTPGAELHPWVAQIADRTISKGENPNVEQYSGFSGTHLDLMLKAEGFENLIITGLATDYCVKATAIDAVAAGFSTFVALGACRAVEPEKETEAVAEMIEAGVKFWLPGEL